MKSSQRRINKTSDIFPMYPVSIAASASILKNQRLRLCQCSLVLGLGQELIGTHYYGPEQQLEVKDFTFIPLTRPTRGFHVCESVRVLDNISTR